VRSRRSASPGSRPDLELVVVKCAASFCRKYDPA
jgi:hypothetical protein